ncbi:lipase [Medicago truncatula]|uniref:Lipase n=1 Tax=Medicago truncatula TaxID=3880 RepID=A0A072TFM9_MEDTR|nr:lipase [Medicago truncatula]
MQILGADPVTPLIVTGRGLGGSIASLFTISLLDNHISSWNFRNRPLCITFGSPLVGDKKLQQAISRSSNWNSCFIHVVSRNDPLPRLFVTNYMPLGTFLFCSDSGSTCFENPDSNLEILITLNKVHGQNQGFDSAEYGNLVEKLRRKTIFKDSSTPTIDKNNSDSLAIGISLQLQQTLRLTPQLLQEHDININVLETKIKKLEDFIQKKTSFDPSKKLNEMKRHMMVEEAELKPQREGAAFRNRWLFGGTTYRRMVEPLAIEWLEEDSTKTKNELNSTSKKKVEVILTIDSCFWAHVEEAILACKELKEVKDKEEVLNKLVEFEDYVYGLLKDYAVSPEIFLRQSSYMSWWKDYKAIKGSSYTSKLANFMNDAGKIKLYGLGAYDFP